MNAGRADRAFHVSRIPAKANAMPSVGRMVTDAAKASPAPSDSTFGEHLVDVCPLFGKRPSSASRPSDKNRIDGPCCHSDLDAVDQALVANANVRPQPNAQRHRTRGDPRSRRYA